MKKCLLEQCDECKIKYKAGLIYIFIENQIYLILTEMLRKNIYCFSVALLSCLALFELRLTKPYNNFKLQGLMIKLTRPYKDVSHSKRSQSLTFVALCKTTTNFLQVNFLNSLFRYVEKVVFSLHFLFHPNSY